MATEMTLPVTEEVLEKIKNWPIIDFVGLFEFIEKHWQYADCGYFTKSSKRVKYTLHTAGWSGNEEIIGALMENHIFWSFYWEQSKRGGHYVFSRLRFMDDRRLEADRERGKR